MSLRILLAEDHVLVRQAVRSLLESEPGFVVSGETSDGKSVLPLISAARPDVLVLDIGLPSLDGLGVIRHLRADGSDLPILALSAHLDVRFVEQLLQSGANGFVHKGGHMDELCEGIREVASGKTFLCRGTTALMQKTQTMIGFESASPRLGRRETEVLRLVARGVRSPQIADEMGIALSTVEVHRRNIMRKLGLRSVAELTQYAIHTGLLRDT